MSHITVVNVRFKDMEVVAIAVSNMGLQLLKDAECRLFDSQTEKMEYVLRLNGPFDAGFKHDQETGTYQLAADWWGGHVAKEIGPNGRDLSKEYAHEMTVKTARQLGWPVSRVKRNGRVKSEVRVPKGANLNALTRAIS